jgi:hypothetical protein
VRPRGCRGLQRDGAEERFSVFAVDARNGTLHILLFAAFSISIPPKHSSVMGCPLSSARFPRGTITASGCRSCPPCLLHLQQCRKPPLEKPRGSRTPALPWQRAGSSADRICDGCCPRRGLPGRHTGPHRQGRAQGLCADRCCGLNRTDSRLSRWRGRRGNGHRQVFGAPANPGYSRAAGYRRAA